MSIDKDNNTSFTQKFEATFLEKLYIQFCYTSKKNVLIFSLIYHKRTYPKGIIQQMGLENSSFEICIQPTKRFLVESKKSQRSGSIKLFTRKVFFFKT